MLLHLAVMEFNLCTWCKNGLLNQQLRITWLPGDYILERKGHHGIEWDTTIWYFMGYNHLLRYNGALITNHWHMVIILGHPMIIATARNCDLGVAVSPMSYLFSRTKSVPKEGKHPTDTWFRPIKWVLKNEIVRSLSSCVPRSNIHFYTFL